MNLAELMGGFGPLPYEQMKRLEEALAEAYRLGTEEGRASVLSVAEAAERAEVAKTRAYSMIRQGRYPYRKSAGVVLVDDGFVEFLRQTRHRK